MAVKWLQLVLVSALCLWLGAVASAQSFQARVTYNTNLRASYSLRSAIVETLPAGTTVSVVGKFNRWLKVDRQGSQVWMADWVPYTQIEGGRVDSDIDNCCFVNRQCDSEREWVSGYWAYQRDECPVSAGAGVSTQPASSQPADADNCCFLGWQCHSQSDWQRGYWARQNNQCATSPSSASGSHGSLRIEGSETFHIWVNAGLDLLKRKARQWYDYVINGTRLIKEQPPGSGAGAYVQSRTHGTAWDPNDYPNDLNIFTIAHEMVHEACHMYQYLAGNPSWNPAQPWLEEKECVERELDVMPLLDPQDRYGRQRSRRRLIENIHNPDFWWW